MFIKFLARVEDLLIFSSSRRNVHFASSMNIVVCNNECLLKKKMNKLHKLA